MEATEDMDHTQPKRDRVLLHLTLHATLTAPSTGLKLRRPSQSARRRPRRRRQRRLLRRRPGRQRPGRQRKPRPRKMRSRPRKKGPRPRPPAEAKAKEDEEQAAE